MTIENVELRRRDGALVDVEDRNAVRCRETEYVVEATDFEALMLWQEWHCFVRWEQDPTGYIDTIGSFGGRPVAVSVSWYKINGRRVAFYEATSQVVDYRLVEEWRDKTFPRIHEGHGHHRCNAMNFGHCLQHVWPHETRPAHVMAEQGALRMWPRGKRARRQLSERMSLHGVCRLLRAHATPPFLTTTPHVDPHRTDASECRDFRTRECRHCGQRQLSHDNATRRCPEPNRDGTSFWPVGEPGGG